MTRPALWPWPVYSEVRALLVPWLASVVGIIVPEAVFPRFMGYSVVAYVLGTAAIGALSIGHEYSDRTLSQLLIQPVDRQRHLVAKLRVLVPMVLALSVTAYAVLWSRFSDLSGTSRLALFVFPALGGLCVAPWLTMVCRSPLAGTVFTLTIPGIVMLAGGLIGTEVYGWRGVDLELFRIAFFWRVALIVCAVGSVATWWTFLRLEAIDGRDADLHLPAWLRRRPVKAHDALSHVEGSRELSSIDAEAEKRSLTRRDPLWLLVAKELRLQQMTFVVATLYVLWWIAVLVWTANAAIRPMVSSAMSIFWVLSLFYVLLIGLMAGSLACAEERRLGTIEWQVLLPMAMWKQWTVKVGVVMTLAIVLAVGLPAALGALTPVKDQTPVGWQLPTWKVVLSLAAGSVYVSSLWGNGLWALLASIAVSLLTALFGGQVLIPLGIWTSRACMSLWTAMELSWIGRANVPPRWAIDGLDVLLIVGFLAFMMRFALGNHRSADRPLGRVLRHVLRLTLFAIVGVVLSAGVTSLQGVRW